jgi:sarcosine oxidase
VDYDAIVLGLGGLGSGALYWLARRLGGRVLGLEQYEIGHVRGGSQDHSRIIRYSYHTPGYVRLAFEAYAAWAALEADAGEKLIVKTGGLDFAPRHARIPLSDYINSLTACGVPFDYLDAAEIMRRWPQFRLTDDIHGLYQADSGIAPAAKCMAAHLRLARAYGAALVDNSTVTAIRDRGGEIEVVAGGRIYRCGKLVIAAGAFSNTVLGYLGLRLPLTVTQEQVVYYATPHLDEFQPERFPIWIWMDDPCFYGFPVYGEPATKAAQDVGGDEVTPETRTFEPNPATARRLTGFMERYLPRAVGPVHSIKTCLYDMPPDRDFVLDALPGHPGIFLALGAAHGFKFSSVFGRILSELALDGRTTTDLSPFSYNRPILHMENPPRSFMV